MLCCVTVWFVWQCLAVGCLDLALLSCLSLLFHGECLEFRASPCWMLRLSQVCWSAASDLGEWWSILGAVAWLAWRKAVKSVKSSVRANLSYSYIFLPSLLIFDQLTDVESPSIRSNPANACVIWICLTRWPQLHPANTEAQRKACTLVAKSWRD